jgi:hypothetical protein
MGKFRPGVLLLLVRSNSGYRNVWLSASSSSTVFIDLHVKWENTLL